MNSSIDAASTRIRGESSWNDADRRREEEVGRHGMRKCPVAERETGDSHGKQCEQIVAEGFPNLKKRVFKFTNSEA